MFPGVNPKQLQNLMKQMGIQQQEIPAEKVIIKTNSGKDIIIERPSVVKINMQGQESWQVVGESHEEETPGAREADIQTIMQQTGCSKEQAERSLQESKGDLAEAILKIA
jgi:nascent polypeptide-associated complex subunit alpha